MHDLDRTTLETNGFDFEEAFEMDDEYDYEMDDEYDYENDYESDYEDEYDYENDYESDYEDEYDYENDYESDYEIDPETGSPFSEEEEAELAYELLAVNSEAEMDEFFKKLMRRAGRGLKRFARNPFKAIGRGLKKVAKFALPIAGRVAGSIFGGPLGGAIGGRLGKAASNIFEIEMEGLSPEDQEFEVARRFVRFSGAAARNSMKNAKRMPPGKATNLGFKKAARQHAPGLMKASPNFVPVAAQKAGRWYRVGEKIILMGIGPAPSPTPPPSGSPAARKAGPRRKRPVKRGRR